MPRINTNLTNSGNIRIKRDEKISHQLTELGDICCVFVSNLFNKAQAKGLTEDKIAELLADES